MKQLSPVAKVFGYPIIIIGYIIDIALNWFVMSLIMLDYPREFTITARLNYLIKSGTPRRRKLACWMCYHLLDAFDPEGTHCIKRDCEP